MSKLPKMYPAQAGSPYTELAVAFNGATDTEIVVVSGSTLPEAPNLVCLEGLPGSGVFRYEGKTGNTLTDVTHVEGVKAGLWPVGAYAFRGFSAYDHNALISNIADKVGTSDSYRQSIYGVRVDKTEQNPEEAVEYIDSAVGFVPMRGNDGNFLWGSWEAPFKSFGIRPCLVEEGEVTGYLNPDDYTQMADGSAATISSGDADVMVEFPKVYWQLSEHGNYRYFRFSLSPHDGFVCLAHTYGDEELDDIRIAAYAGWESSGKLRSLSGKTPTGNKTIDVFRGYAQANGDGYEQFTFYELTMLQVLYAVFFKSLDSQTALGRGNVESSGAKATGSRDQDGMFYGVSTENSNEVTKFCGIEGLFDNIRAWVDGIWSTANTTPARKLWITTGPFDGSAYYNDDGTWKDASPMPSHYKEYGTGFGSNIEGYMKDIHGENETGFVTANSSGSASTYYCDYGYLRAGRVGNYGGSWGYASSAGAFSLHLNYDPAYSASNVGARLSHMKKGSDT